MVILERKTYVHALENLELLHTLDTCPNPKVRCSRRPSRHSLCQKLPHDAVAGGRHQGGALTCRPAILAGDTPT